MKANAEARGGRAVGRETGGAGGSPLGLAHHYVTISQAKFRAPRGGTRCTFAQANDNEFANPRTLGTVPVA